MIRLPLRALSVGALVLTAAPAFAHTGAGEAHGFIHGFMHPVGGMDHVLAMVLVGIALSVVVLGAALAMGLRLPVAVAAGVVGLFAIFHGHAHGAEMPENAGGLTYALGFMLATALLHGVGLEAGYALARFSAARGALISRLAGGLASLAGVGLLVGTL